MPPELSGRQDLLDEFELGPIRAEPIDKGLIYTPDHGLVAFTVPLFADHLLRTMKFSPRA